MRRPPMLMRMDFDNGDQEFGLWLPLFLLLPLALVVLIILSPLILMSVLVLWPWGWGKRALLVLWAALGIYCLMRGLRVDVQNGNQWVYISVV